MRPRSSELPPNSITATVSAINSEAGVRQNVRAENPIGLRVGHEFHDAFDVFVCDGPAIRAEGKLPDTHLHSFFFREIFGDAGTCEFGIGVDDAGDNIVVHVTGFPGDHFDAGDAFFLGLVRQHRARDDVADRVDAFDVRAEMLVHFHASSIIERDAEFSPRHHWKRATARWKRGDAIGLEFQFFAAFRRSGDRAPSTFTEPTLVSRWKAMPCAVRER